MDLSDASVQKAITSVADLGSETRWALFSYSKVEAKSGPPAICLVDKGTGTLSELVAKLRADDIYYGYVRLVVGDATSVSTKFLFATYVGGKVSPLKRARVSVHKTVFAKSLPALNWEVFSEKLEELDENQIITNFTKTSGYGGWALASKSAREANAAGTLRRKPKAPAVPINVDAALEEEKKIQAQAAVRKEEAKKRSGKRLDILKQQKSSNSLQGNSTAALNASASAPAPATSTMSLAPPPSGVHALLAKAEADEKARQAESKRVEEEANKRRLDSARAAGEEAKAKAATTEAEFKRAAAELAEKKRSEEALQRQAEAAAAARKASEDANAVAVAAAAAAKKAAEEAQIAAANAVAARKAAEDAAERRRAEETKRQEEAKRQEEKERERKERKEREERERRDKKDKERKEKRDERADRKEKERKDKDRAPSTPTAPPPSTPVIIEETVVSLSVPAKQPEVAAPKSPQPKVRKILGIGQGATQGHRPDMEDRHVALSQLPFDADTAFVAVYDGHGGSPAAEYCKTVLHTNITRDPNYKTDVHKAIVNGFLKTDAEFLDVCRAAELEAGCTANAVFVTPTRMIVANAGDCRCILSRGGKVHLLSRDHKPYDATEKKRIEMAGYYVEDNRVDGRLAVSRAIGDIDFKQAKGKTAEQQAVTALPEIIDEEREDDDEFLVVACDGLWDVLENEGVLEFIATRFELMNLDQIAQELVDYAVEIGSMDNTTAVIVRFK